jgi:hypothetical protein
MPRGFAAVQEAAEKLSRKTGGSGSGAFYLKLPDDGSQATVRFLEQGDDVYSYWYHDFSTVDKAQGWRIKFPCLDQEDDGTPCPGCEEKLSRKFQLLINLIWRDAPVLKRDDDGNFVRDKNDEIVIDGEADQVAVWRGGIELAKLLNRKDIAFKGLSSRDFEITREGLKLDTTYSIEPADVDSGAVKMSKDDSNLANDKYDLEDVANFKTYDEAKEIIDENLSEGSSEDDKEDAKRFLKSSPFKK